MTREIEISVAAMGHLVLDRDSQSASWCLPASKTDPRAWAVGLWEVARRLGEKLFDGNVERRHGERSMRVLGARAMASMVSCSSSS